MSSILVATASYDKQVKLWRVHPVEQTRSFQFASDSHVNCLAVSSDRSRLAAAGYTSIRVYDLTALTGEGSAPHSANQTYITSQSQDNMHTGNITSIGFVRSVQGAHMLVSVSEDGTWKLWDTRQQTLRLKRVVDVKEPLNCGILLHNSMLVAGTQLGTIGLWSLNAATGADAQQQRNADGLLDQVSVISDDPAIRTVALSPGGDMLVAATSSGRVYVFALHKTLNPATTAAQSEEGDKAEGDAGASTAPEADGDNADDQAASTASPAAPEAPANASMYTAGTDSKAPAGATPFVRGGHGLLSLVWTFEAHSRYILKCCVSPNGAMLCTTSADCTVNLWRVPESLPKLVEDAASEPPSGASTEPRSERWTLERSITGHQRWVWDCAFSRCSLYVVTASSDHTGRLWHVASGKLEATFAGHQKPVTCIVLDDRRD